MNSWYCGQCKSMVVQCPHGGIANVGGTSPAQPTPAAPPPCPNCERLGRELYCQNSTCPTRHKHQNVWCDHVIQRDIGQLRAERDAAQARVKELEARVGTKDVALKLAQHARDQLQAEVERLREALERIRVGSQDDMSQRIAGLALAAQAQCKESAGSLHSDSANEKRSTQAQDLCNRTESRQNASGDKGNAGEVMQSHKLYPNGDTDPAKSEKAENYTREGILPEAQLAALERVAEAAGEVLADCAAFIHSDHYLDALNGALARLRATGWRNG